MKLKVSEDEWKLELEIGILCLKQRKTQCFGVNQVTTLTNEWIHEKYGIIILSDNARLPTS